MKRSERLSFLFRDRPKHQVVRGRLREWQFTAIAICLGLLALLLVNLAIKPFTEAIGDRLCDAGPFGITIGWWYVAIALTLIELTIAAAVVPALLDARAIRRQERFPPIGKVRLIDAELKVGRAAIRYAWMLGVSSALSLGFVAWLAYMKVDIVSTYGRNMSLKDEAECKSVIVKRRYSASPSASP
jgi:hypothetical protein